jgi:hypothetical protein
MGEGVNRVGANLQRSGRKIATELSYKQHEDIGFFQKKHRKRSRTIEGNFGVLKCIV